MRVVRGAILFEVLVASIFTCLLLDVFKAEMVPDFLVGDLDGWLGFFKLVLFCIALLLFINLFGDRACLLLKLSSKSSCAERLRRLVVNFLLVSLLRLFSSVVVLVVVVVVLFSVCSFFTFVTPLTISFVSTEMTLARIEFNTLEHILFIFLSSSSLSSLSFSSFSQLPRAALLSSKPIIRI